MRFAYKTGAKPLAGYTIKRGVGSGGFGEVYFAVSDAGKEVALKCIQRNLDIEVRGVTQCLNLKHPNLIALYDIKYDDEGQAWVVMEFVNGESLKDVIDRNPHGLPADEVDHWFGEIAAGVAYLHDHGIVHRDLKPGNIFQESGSIKVGDYGLSKFISCSRGSGQTESVGTLHYMAPEIGKGNYGKQIDIYALGVMLFELLTGRVPFEGESAQEIIMKHLTDDPDLSGIAAPYRDVIRRALRKDPQQRFASVDEMMAALSPSSSQPRLETRKAADDDVVAAEALPAKGPPIFIDAAGQSHDPDIVFGPLQLHQPPVAPQLPPVRTGAARIAPRNNHQQHSPLASAACPTRAWHPPAAVEKWRHSPVITPLKLVLFAVIGLVVVFNPWLVPVGIVFAFPFLMYLAIAALIRACSPGREYAGEFGRVRHADVNWRTIARDGLRRKLASERISELCGSMLLSAAIAATVCLVLLLVLRDSLNPFSVDGWSIFAWLSLSSIAASWLLLAMGKFWEGREGEHFHRRFAMLVAGLAIGAITFAANRFFLVEFPGSDSWTATGAAGNRLGSILQAADGSPLLSAYLVYFAGLFVILRWWTQVDPLRRTRLSLLATLACVMWAWIMHLVCQFPQPWGLILAATISVSVQLSSPWLRKTSLRPGSDTAIYQGGS